MPAAAVGALFTAALLSLREEMMTDLVKLRRLEPRLLLPNRSGEKVRQHSGVKADWEGGEFTQATVAA